MDLWLLPLIFVGILFLLRLIAWAGGWSPLPAGVQLGNEPGEIPCLHDLPKLEGRWANGNPGKLPGKGWWVYRQFDRSGGLVYEGRTNNATRRFGDHAESGKQAEEGWHRWELYQCPDEEYMMNLEKLGILFHRPATNKERWELTKIYVDPEDYIDDELRAIEEGGFGASTEEGMAILGG